MATDIEFNVRNGMTVGASKHLVLDVDGGLSARGLTMISGQILSGGQDILSVASNEISITESQITDLQDYLLASDIVSSTNWDATYVAVTGASANWDTAYGWGDHATQSYATQTYVTNAISDVISGAPAALDTLNELASALNDDANFATNVTNSIATKWTQDDTKITNWDSTHTSVYNTSSDWNNTHTSVSTNSANWDDVYSHVQTTSSSWGGAAGYTQDIGNNSDTTIDVTHNLNTLYITYSVIDNNTNEFINTQTSIVDTNTVRFTFDTAPTTNEYKVVIISTDGTATGGGSGGSSYTDTDVADYLNGNLDTHIIPDTNAAYDLGNAEYKIRHLYLSSNSIYMGDDNTPIRLQNKKLFVDDVEVGSNIINYSTEELPTTATNGTIALDKTINTPVYYLDGKWKKLSDDTDVADNRLELEVYLLAGQSNAGGTGDSANLSNYTQADGEGTLAETREQILFSNNHNQDQSGTPGSLSPSGNHGIEVSFLDKIDNIRNKKQLVVKYYSGGSEIETWEKDTGTNNNWDKMMSAITNVTTWATAYGYNLDWKGFIWFQGESDAGDDQADHKLKLQQLITNVRTHLNRNETGEELPVCLIQVDNRIATFDSNGDYASSTRVSSIETVRGAQQEVADEDSRVETIDTGAYHHLMDWNESGHGVHWQTEAYVGIGRDTATRIDQIIEGTLTYGPPAPNLWLDASDESTITHNDTASQRISEWRDKSGNNYHATPVSASRQLAYTPYTLNDLKVVRLENAREMRSLTPDSGNWQDTYIVARWDGGETFNDFRALFTGTVNVGSDNGWQGRRDTKDLYSKGFGQTIYLNGAEHGINDVLPTLSSPFIANMRADFPVTVNGYCVGNDRLLGNRNWIGLVAEIVCFGRKLTDDERIEMEGYLAHKWGITDILPTDHLYKTIAP